MFRLNRQSPFLYDYLTLKRRIIIIFLISSIIPFVSIALISYSTIYSILNNKMQSGIQSNLKQVELSLENTISNLNHVSQQMAFEGTVGKKLDQYLSTDSPSNGRRLPESSRMSSALLRLPIPRSVW
ncbi:hypothetical protein LJK88_18210 [Paenibacillus sp. P26]|nr:hypothetical protein LJK88_18210 [Paenibacillus sp. P26]UUZ96328.1 hypothetical protein LJK87_19605 [Paenibacillus sp. P25]